MSISHTNSVHFHWFVTLLLVSTVLTACFQPLPVARPVQTPTPTFTLPLKAQINVTALRVRSGPGTKYRRITVISNADEVSVTGQINNCAWFQIVTAQGVEGWVFGQYVSLNIDCNQVPIATLLPASTPMIIATLTPQSVALSNRTEELSIPLVPNPTTMATLEAQRTAVQIPLSDSNITLIRPLDATLRGRVTFEWLSKIPLDTTQAFEPVLWLPSQDPLENGFGLAAASSATTISIDLDQAADRLPQLQAGRDYKWGVLVVNRNPYQRLIFLGAEHQFRFERSESPGTLVPLLIPLPTPVPLPTPAATPMPLPPPLSTPAASPMPQQSPVLIGQTPPTTPPPVVILGIQTPTTSGLVSTPKPVSLPTVAPTSPPKPTNVSSTPTSRATAATAEPTSTPKPTEARSTPTPKPTSASTEAPTSTQKPADTPNTPTPKPTSVPTVAPTSAPKPTDVSSQSTPKPTSPSKNETPTKEPPSPTP